MNYFPQTSIYQENLALTKNFLAFLKTIEPSNSKSKLENSVLKLNQQIAVALKNDQPVELKDRLLKAQDIIFSIKQQLDLLVELKEISEKDGQKLVQVLEDFAKSLLSFVDRRKKVLILSSVLGQGHMSASKSLKEGMEKLYGRDYQIDIIDFYKEIGELFNSAVKKAYEGSTKHLPNFYKYFFESTDSKWPVKLLNIANYPFNASKLEKLFKRYDADIVISAFPIWDYLASLVMKKCKTKHFISVVTDSISIHNAWVTGDPDFHIVANNETAISLKKLGVKEEKIKVLGFPVKLAFSEKSNRQKFWDQFGFDSKNYTITLLPTAEKVSRTVKMIEEIRGNFPSTNLAVICGRSEELFPKLEHFNQEKNIKIIGWTDQMPEFIKNCDLVITKAGGATVMECIAAKKPMIITQIIPGQEMGNAELIKLHNLGIIQKSASMTIAECVDYMQKNENLFRQNLEKISRPLASLEIAEFIDGL